jgi:pimeloyl-ACP methyl ester carboxylesterase
MERPGEGPTIVMIHGTLDRGRSFSRVARRLPNHLVTYDRRGYHDSRHLGRASGMDQHLADLAEIIDATSTEPVVLVGHSFGGVVALAAGLSYPERISQVVAFEPPMPWLADSVQSHRGVPVSEDPAQAVEGFFRRMVSDAAWERMSQEAKAERIADGNGVIGDLNIIRFATPFELDAVVDLAVPLTIGLGGETSMAHHKENAKRIAAVLPTCRISTFEDAGHGAHMSHPDQFADLITNAISDH